MKFGISFLIFFLIIEQFLMKENYSFIPKYDPEFKPAILEMHKFQEKVLQSPEKTEIIICLERNKGYNYHYKTLIYKDGTGHDDENYFIIERICKMILWVVGGHKFYIAGSDLIAKKLREEYTENGKRKFDVLFFRDVYEKDIEVISCSKDQIPKLNEEEISLSKGLNGNRIGFDAGGSDLKISAVVNGEVKYSKEIVWNPKLNSDPNYHIDGIMDSFYKASEYMPTIDSVGISTAGVVVDNRIMVSSLFLKVSKEDYKKKIKTIYIDCVKKLEQKYNKKISFIVANDGDVTAFAGLMEFKTSNGIVGIAMGTSEAGGFITKEGKLTGWINELAFVPIDFNLNAERDPWSGDYGTGERYFSQEGVIKLAIKAGIKFGEDLTPANKLKYIQNLIENGNNEEKKIVEEIFNDMGIYLGYSIPLYAHFYDFQDLLLLGRVVSGKGGNIIIEKAKEVLKNEFPNISAKIEIHIPDENSRRVGQSVAAACLPQIIEN